MKLAHPFLENPIIFEENKVNILVVEHQKVFSELVHELLEQTNDVEGRFILSCDLKQLNFHKEVEMVIDLFTLELNQKKTITKLYSQLKTSAIGSEYYLDTTCLLGEITQFLEKILQTTQYPLVYSDEIDIASIFKLADVKFETLYNSLVEKLLDYLVIVQEFCDISCFIFVNLKCYLLDEEIAQLYKFISYKKLNILLLENTMREKRFEEEKIYIIDGDLCEIY